MNIRILFCIFFSLISTTFLIAQKIFYFEDFAPEIQSPVSVEVHPLGDILIGDNFANVIFRVNPFSGAVSQSSTQNYDLTLSNPVSLSANQLYILALDVDNQALFRYDNQLRPVSVITEDQLRISLDFTRIIYSALDNRNYLYLLDGVHYNIMVLDQDLKFLYSFGGVQDAQLEFGMISEFHPFRKNEFLTYDRQKQIFVTFDYTGNRTGQFRLTLDEIIDFCSNYSGSWAVLGIRGKELVLLQENSGKKQTQIPLLELKDKHVIDMAMHPFRNEVVILFQDGFTIVQSDK